MSELSQGAYIAWRLAAGETTRTRQPYIEQEAVLIGMCSLGRWLRSNASELRSQHKGQALEAIRAEARMVETVLKSCALDPDLLSRAVRAAIGPGERSRGDEVVHRSQACRMFFQRAEHLAWSTGSGDVSCLHLLAAMLEQPGPLIARALMDFGAEVAWLRTQVESHLAVSPRRAPPAGPLESTALASVPQSARALDTPYLDRYGYDMTQGARDGKIDPIVGRKDELLALVRTLHQKTKNIPVLISEPGVSRVAVVKGLALRIAHGDVVASMRTKRIVELHMHDLARTLGSRRQFAQCVGQLLEEASRHPDIVLFFDEMHAVMGSGSGEGSIDVANLLKPALSKGNLRCIGATTLEDYRRFIAPDALLDRYCQAIVVNEPSSSEMQEILVQIRPQYEEHHMVRITPEALEAIVELASKHMPEKRFPEKAIDILDQACSRARISQVTQLEALMTAESLYEVTRETIAAVIAQKTGLPVAHVLEPPRERLQRLARELQAQVKGGGKL